MSNQFSDSNWSWPPELVFRPIGWSLAILIFCLDFVPAFKGGEFRAEYLSAFHTGNFHSADGPHLEASIYEGFFWFQLLTIPALIVVKMKPFPLPVLVLFIAVPFLIFVTFSANSTYSDMAYEWNIEGVQGEYIRYVLFVGGSSALVAAASAWLVNWIWPTDKKQEGKKGLRFSIKSLLVLMTVVAIVTWFVVSWRNSDLFISAPVIRRNAGLVIMVLGVVATGLAVALFANRNWVPNLLAPLVVSMAAMTAYKFATRDPYWHQPWWETRDASKLVVSVALTTFLLIVLNLEERIWRRFIVPRLVKSEAT